jgi:hypothetical protein
MREKSDRDAETHDLRDVLEGFSSEAERIEALARFARYLAKLKAWDRQAKVELPEPSEN